MKIIRFLSLSLVFLFVFNVMQPAYAFQDYCPRHDLKTSMKNRLYKTRVFRGTTQGFTEYTIGHSGGGRVLGFVEYRLLTTSFEAKFEVVNLGQQKYCVRMTHVRGYFNMHPKLFMPTDYAKGSCEYKEILKHEKRHLSALKRFHKKYSPKFEAHFGRIAKALPVPNPVSSAKHVELVQDQLLEYFVTEFKDFEFEAARLLDIEQSKIDSPSEYRGVAMRCDNW